MSLTPVTPAWLDSVRRIHFSKREMLEAYVADLEQQVQAMVWAASRIKAAHDIIAMQAKITAWSEFIQSIRAMSFADFPSHQPIGGGSVIVVARISVLDGQSYYDAGFTEIYFILSSIQVRPLRLRHLSRPVVMAGTGLTIGGENVLGKHVGQQLGDLRILHAF